MNKSVPWIDFENEVADYMERSICDGEWSINPNASRVRRKPAYFSNARQSNIIFDVSIEVFQKGQPDKVLFLWLIECKDYPTRKVKVDEIEEFHAKLTQVGAHKGTVFTRCGFESGAIQLADTYRMGLSTLSKQEHLSLKASAATSGGFFVETGIESTSFSNASEDGSEPLTLTDILRQSLDPFGLLVCDFPIESRRATPRDLD